MLQLIELFNYLLISNIFTGAFVFNNGSFDFYISYIFMIGFILAYIFINKKIFISRSFIYIFAAAFLISFLNILLGNNSISLLFKTAIAFILNGMVYYLLIKLNNYNVEKLFRIYLRLAYIIALIAIFQEICFLVGFKYGYDFRYFIPRMVSPQIQLGMLRVTSILQEPTHFGTAVMPALFVSILNLLSRKNNFISKQASFLIIISTLLTFSLLVYVGIIFAVILIMLNYYRSKTKIIATTMLLIALTWVMYRYIPVIRLKVNDTIMVMTGKQPLEKVNLTTFAFCSNGIVAGKSFRHNPLFGSGLGSHPKSYDRYISEVIDPQKIIMVLNKKDASGLFFRLISETGLFGIVLFFYFIFKFYVSKDKDGHFWIVSNSILCLFILNLLRQGNYFYGGFIFFIFLYYYASKNLQLPKVSNLN